MSPHPDVRRRALLATLLGSAAGLGACAQLATGLGIAPVLQRLGLMDAPAPVLAPGQAQALRALDAQGARALLANDVDGAIAAWRRYVQQAPATLARARELRGHLTLLEREAARRFVQGAASREAQQAFVRTDARHVAVLPFASVSPSPGFNRAVVAMIAVDLARVPGITVLEREKVALLAQELQLSDSGLVDAASAARSGALLGAGTLVSGSVFNEPGPAGPGSGRYRLGSAVSDVARARVLGHSEAQGRQDEFFTLQKRIVHGVLDLMGVGRGIDERPDAVNHPHTRNWEAYARFARGLQLLAEDRFAEAREALLAALKLDPAFALAEEAFLAAPERALTLDELRAAAARAMPG
jgi:TolB-like protein